MNALPMIWPILRKHFGSNAWLSTPGISRVCAIHISATSEAASNSARRAAHFCGKVWSRSHCQKIRPTITAISLRVNAFLIAEKSKNLYLDNRRDFSHPCNVETIFRPGGGLPPGRRLSQEFPIYK